MAQRSRVLRRKAHVGALTLRQLVRVLREEGFLSTPVEI
jgi:hypothetical protein